MTEAAKPSSANTPVWALCLLFLLYALPGTLGHGPWRGDDGTFFGVVDEMLRSGQWLYPAIAGQPFLDNPPLYYWIAALFGKLLGGLMPLPDAARLASPFCVAVTLYCLARCARRFYGGQADRAAVLLGIGLLGLLTHAHEFQPQLALLACSAASFVGFAEFLDHPRRGALIAGVAIGLAFLAAGLPALTLLMPLWAVLPGLCPECRKPGVALELGLGAAVALLLCCAWPLLLHVAHPGIAAAWWAQELGDIALHSGHFGRANALLELFAWFMWPLWPIAGWALWRERRNLRQTRFLLPLAALVLAILLVVGTGPLRPAYALPLVPPLILLATAGLPTLKRGAASFLDWFGRMSLLAVGVFLWLAWFAQHFGWPAPIARNVARLVPEFVPRISWPALAVGVLLALGWALLVIRPPRSPLRVAMSWATGVTFVWVSASLLFSDFVDRDKRYDEIAASLKTAISSRPYTCIAASGLGSSQIAAFAYLQKLRFEPAGSAATPCEWLLVYSNAREPALEPGAGWTQRWHQERSRRRTAEALTLYRRSIAD